MSTTDELKIDRTGWDPGPWDREPDKLNWTTEAGLPGMIVRNRMGALCGYVAVMREHPLYGIEYNHGEWPDSPEAQIRVHGGLTYSDRCRGSICHVPEPGEPDDVWWFGFDCAHSGDYTPSNGRWRKEARLTSAWAFAQGADVYRTIEYVHSEVEILAMQLAAYAQRPPQVPPTKGETQK